MGIYSHLSIDHIYELLFCDDIELYRAGNNVSAYPWKELFDPQADNSELNRIISDPEVESRTKILASNILLERGADVGKHLYGVITEVGMPEGLDVVAAYEDYSARYINFTGKTIVWETRNVESDALIDDLIAASRAVVEQIGPWDRARLAPPRAGNVRISFLVSDGLYFGEAPFADLTADPMGGAVVNAAGRLMSYLIQNATGQSA